MEMLPVETNKRGLLLVSIIMLLVIFTSSEWQPFFSTIASLFRQDNSQVVGVGMSESQLTKHDTTIPSSLPVAIKSPAITENLSQSQLKAEDVEQQLFCFNTQKQININKSATNCSYILTTGWNQLEPWGIWSTANAEMQIDLPKDCQDTNTCDLKLFLPMGIYNASAAKPKKVFAKIEGQSVAEWSIAEQKTISIPLDSKNLQGNVENIKIQFLIPDAESPGKVDTRILGIALGAYQFIKHNAN